jgi:hypothetical protein
MTQQLSPAAQAVFHAFNSKFDWVEDGVPGPQFNSIAAALRAAADQLGESPAPGAEFEDLYPRIIEVPDLLAIADELETL